MSKATALTFDEVMDLIDSNVLGGIMAAKRSHDGVRRRMHDSAVQGYAAAQVLKNDPASCRAFYDLEFWGEGSERNSKHILKHTLQFIYGDRTGSDSKRAEDHARAMQPYFDAKKSAEEVREALHQGGFDLLKKGTAALKVAGGDDKVTEEVGGKVTEEVGGKATEEVGGGKPSGSSPADTKGKAAPPKPEPWWPRMKMADVFQHLLITMERDELAQFLPDESSVGDTATIQIVRDKDAANKMLIWRAVNIDYDPAVA